MTGPYLLAIDPGNVESAYVEIDSELRPLDFGKVPNEDLMGALPRFLCGPAPVNVVAVEMVASYGMAVGSEVFDTCVWIGRFAQAIDDMTGRLPRFVYRRDVKLHLCGQARAKDANVRQALIDRFGGKGTKAQPGFFYGFKADVWAAFALAVTVAETGGYT